MSNTLFNTAENQPRWWFIGLFWGTIMFVVMGVIFPLIVGEFTSRTLLRGLLACTLGSFVFVYLLKLWVLIDKKRKTKKQ